MTDLLHTLTKLSHVKIAVIIEQQLQLEDHNYAIKLPNTGCPIQNISLSISGSKQIQK